MGKEWLYWVGGGGRSTKRQRSVGGERNTDTTTPGCMCSIIQLFDFPPFHLPFHKPDTFLPEETTTHEGLEAPRNSLELKEPNVKAAQLSSTMKKDEENLTILMGIQIKTSSDSTSRTRRSRTDDLSPYCSDSPSTKTPLVARLMGLDLLPNSPSSTLSNHSISNPQVHSVKTDQFHSRRSNKSTCLFYPNMITGTRSLPETPRTSSAQRSDVDHHHHHHRLSLQINKENIANLSQEFEFSCSTRTRRTCKSFKRRDLILDHEDTRSPRHYAKQIVKQVKESVISKRVGLDITNTIKNRDQRRDAKNVVMLKSKNPKFLEPKKKKVKKEVFKNQNSLTSKPSSHNKFPSKKPIQKYKRDVSEQFSTTLMIRKPLKGSNTNRTKKEEIFAGSSTTKRANLSDKKCIVPTIVLVKKDTLPPAAKLPQKQVSNALSSTPNTQIYSCLSHPYNQNAALQQSNNHDRSNGTAATTTTGKGEEIQYITRILKRTGIDKNTLVSFTKWYSPTQPIDPSIFHYLELFYPNSHINQICNRKLKFQLVNEILGEILKPNFNLKPWVTTCGTQLVDALWGQIRNFPLADCRVLEDIDALIDYDLRRSTRQQRSAWFGDEGESIVSEIEGHIVDYLVYETAMVCVFGVACPYK